ncbi:MAG: hypothetical protein JWO45_1042 [Spartobacteria bacterium]|nr:hypothetical protein [Spartobacteria bacterium]
MDMYLKIKALCFRKMRITSMQMCTFVSLCLFASRLNLRQLCTIGHLESNELLLDPNDAIHPRGCARR